MKEHIEWLGPNTQFIHSRLVLAHHQGSSQTTRKKERTEKNCKFKLTEL